MYEDFFGLSDRPFALTPNPKFVFQSEQYQTVEEALLYGVAQKDGLMVVTGAPGSGKTTLCRDLREKLGPDYHRVALMFNPFLSGVEMLQALLSEFGLENVPTTSRKELLDRLDAYLVEELAQGRTCIAIFDDAQHLSTDVLELIRVLTNLETDREKLIPIVLVGQPELLALIRTSQMAQLDQRVSMHCTLTHLSRDETAQYVDHRLNVAGARGRVKFDEAGLRRLHRATGGVPRLVNLTCDRALLAGFAEQTRSISGAHVRDAITTLRGEGGIDVSDGRTPSGARQRSRRQMWWLVGSASVAAALVLGFIVSWFAFDAGAELLAWQGAVARSSRDAEQAYVRIARHHPGSRRREYALLRLAQLQIAKGDGREALRWLDVLHRDYPAATSGDERQYWIARALFADGDTVRACAATREMDSGAADALGPAYSMINEECDLFEARARAIVLANARARAQAADSASVQASDPARAANGSRTDSSAAVARR